MNRIEELKEKLRAAIAETRSAIDKGDKDATAKAQAKVDEATAALDAEEKLAGAEGRAAPAKPEERASAEAKAEIERRALEESQRKVPAPAIVPVSGMAEMRKLLAQVATEKRALTVNGTGAVSVVSEIVRVITNKTGLASKYRYFRGPNASTVIPILSPSVAQPVGHAEAATQTDDATAVLATKSLLPKAYISVLGVSAEALLMSGADIEGQLPAVFAEAFQKALFAGSLTGGGTGSDMLGMFTAGAVTGSVSCAATGTPKLLDIAKLALTVQDYMDDAVIVINPALIAAMLAETTAESAPIKQELMTSRSCMGVPVVMTGLAPSAITAASVVAIAMSMSNYGVAIANDLEIVPVRVKGDPSTYFQATMFFNGSTILPANGWKLVTV